VTYEDEFMIMNDKKFVGRALDNRISGFMIAEVARLLHENNVKLPFHCISSTPCRKRSVCAEQK
jgi:putative aminopeptidase FrvX